MDSPTCVYDDTINNKPIGSCRECGKLFIYNERATKCDCGGNIAILLCDMHGKIHCGRCKVRISFKE